MIGLKVAVFPGSFDPFTVGHEQIVRHALGIFDKVVIGVGHSLSKASLLTLDERLDGLRKTFHGEPRIEAVGFQGLAVEFARARSARYIVRGLRSSSDFDYELPMAQTNRAIAPEVQTVFLPTDPSISFVSSTLVRELVKHGGDFSAFVPKPFFEMLKSRK